MAQPEPSERGSELDETDKAIIRELQRNGRAPYAQLGPAVGLSQAAARQRVQRLIERGVMQIVAVTDPLSIGFDLQAMLGVCADGDLRALADDLATISEMSYVVITSGRFDLLVEVVCTSHEHLLHVVNDEIRRRDGVRNVEVFTYLHLSKQSYAWGAP